jgi:hypothetical protein
MDDQALEDALFEAKLAVLVAIRDRAAGGEGGAPGTSVLALSEAYARLVELPAAPRRSGAPASG